jgi:hypothetical protein
MVEIANFVALRRDAFSNLPGGGNDPFVASSTDESVRFRISIDDDDTTIEGDTISNETSNDANQIATISTLDGTVLAIDTSYVEWTATYFGSNGQVITVWRIEVENPITGVGRNFFAMSELPEVGITFTTSNKDQSANGLDPDDIPTGIPCFTPGALITTPIGVRPVEELAVGDLVITKYHGLQPIRWIGQKRISGARMFAMPELQPIRIRKHALGHNNPSEDLIVSQQHRMVVRHALARLYLDNDLCLIPAKSLLSLPGVSHVGVAPTTYIHLMFDQHEVIYANDSETESFHPGSLILSGMEQSVQDEIYEIFPELRDHDVVAAYGATALPALSGAEGLAFIQQIAA